MPEILYRVMAATKREILVSVKPENETRNVKPEFVLKGRYFYNPRRKPGEDNPPSTNSPNGGVTRPVLSCPVGAMRFVECHSRRLTPAVIEILLLAKQFGFSVNFIKNNNLNQRDSKINRENARGILAAGQE